MGENTIINMRPTGLEHHGKPLLISIVDTKKLEQWQQDSHVAKGAGASKPSQQQSYVALANGNEEEKKIIPSSMAITYGLLAGAQKTGEAIKMPIDKIKELGRNIRGEPPPALTPLEEEKLKPKPLRTAIILATENEVIAGVGSQPLSAKNYKQHRIFIGDLQGDLLIVNTMQDENGMSRFDKREIAIPRPELNQAEQSPELAAKLVEKLNTWERNITHSQAPAQEGPGYFVSDQFPTGGKKTTPQNAPRR